MPGFRIVCAGLSPEAGLSGIAVGGGGEQRPAVVRSGFHSISLQEENRGQRHRSSAIRWVVYTGRQTPSGARGVNPDDAFERSLAALYDAALDVDRWPAATAVIEEAVGSHGQRALIGR